MEAARRLMAGQGPDMLTMSKVANAAEVNRTTIYEHFSNRSSLIGAVMSEVAREASEIFKVDLPLNTRISYMVGYFVRNPDIARLWVYQSLSEVPLPDQDGRERYLRAMHTFARSPIAREGIDADMLGEILVSAILLQWRLRCRSTSLLPSHSPSP